MELWIRSQDKETLKLAEMLDIYDLSDNEGQCWAIEECGTTIGYYKSKKRALEVLDEIEDLIMGKTLEKHINKFDTYNSEKIKVYEMPEK